MKSIILIIIGLFLLILISVLLLNSSKKRRKQLEKALQESKGRWELALDASHEGVWDLDMIKGEIYYSPRWEEMFGFIPGEAPKTQEELTLLINPEDLEEVMNEMHRCIQNKFHNYKKEFRMVHNNGTLMWVLCNASIVYNEAKKPVRIVGTTLDITERKKAEAALLLSETRLKLQIERMPIGFIVWTPDFKVMSWNPSAESIFGYTEQEMLGKHPYGYIVHQEAQPIVDAIWKRLVEGDATANSVNDNMTKDGRIITCKWTNTPIRNEDGVVTSVISMIEDITEQKKVEEGLIKSQRNFEEAQAIAHVGSWDYDLSTGNLVWTKEMFSLFEMENHPPETLYETFRSKIHPDDLAKLDEYIQRTIEQGIPYEIEERVALGDGSTRYLSCIGEPVNDAFGNMVGLRGTSQNITPHKQAVLAKSEFLSTMSHEIRTPINGVIGIVNLLMEENLTDLQREYVNTLNFSAQHLSTIVSDILDFSKIESGNLILEKAHFDLEEVCRNVFKLFKNKALEKNIEYCFTPGALVDHLIFGDVFRLNQILTNLLSNAVKFTEEGRVDFGYTIKEDTAEAVTLLFSIKDTGIGIHELEQEKIFEYFSQANERISRKYGGTGLGLTISKRLVEMQGGEIYVESNADKGSIFTVELTFEKIIHPVDSNAKNTSITDALSEVLPGMKILVAEDHHINAMVLVHQLEKWQVACTLVNDGKEAVERLKKENFDLVLMDIWMPNMDGIQALKAIRSMDRETSPQTPVVAFTADASLDSIRGFLENGFDECITKPFNPKSLFCTLKKYYTPLLPFQQLKSNFATLPLEHRQVNPEKSKLFHEVEFVVSADVVAGPKTGV